MSDQQDLETPWNAGGYWSLLGVGSVLQLRMASDERSCWSVVKVCAPPHLVITEPHGENDPVSLDWIDLREAPTVVLELGDGLHARFQPLATSIELEFDSEVVGITDEEGQPVYRLAWPNRIAKVREVEDVPGPDTTD